MGRREENQQQKRARIVAAAKALFSKHGYEETTTRAIARRARIAHGTLFLYAKTREDVVALVFHSEIDDAVKNALATVPMLPPSTSFTDFCLHFYGAFIAVYARDPGLARVLVKELPWLSGPSRAAMMDVTRDVLAAVAARVAVGVSDEEFRGDVDAFAVTTASFSLYFGALIAWLSGEVGDPASDGRTTALALLREGLALLERGIRT